MSEDGLEWCGPTVLTTDELEKASIWIHSMDHEYYSLFGLNHDNTKDKLQELLMAPQSEFGTTQFARRAGVLSGFFTCFLASEIFARRLFVLKSFLAAAPDLGLVKTKLQKFEGANRKVPLETLYLSKIYVDREIRGTGMSAQILERFMMQGKALGLTLTLHVNRKNIAAIALYNKYGFVINPNQDWSEGPYFLMEHKLIQGWQR